MLTLQKLISELTAYWDEQGCLIEQPYDQPMGAGTMHPETFLRVLGPEPWRCAYVQPSRRPADGRYGENPFRLGKHLQFQVILKPSPDDVQQLYLEQPGARSASTRSEHDIRFEEDNWEVADARRLGRRLAGHARRHGDHPVHLLPAGRRHRARADLRRDHLRPRAHRHVPVGSTRIYDVRWGDGLTYGQVRHQEEFELSRYYFEVADRGLRLDAVRRLRARGAALPRGGPGAARVRSDAQVLASVQRPRRARRRLRDRARRVDQAGARARGAPAPARRSRRASASAIRSRCPPPCDRGRAAPRPVGESAGGLRRPPFPAGAGGDAARTTFFSRSAPRRSRRASWRRHGGTWPAGSRGSHRRRARGRARRVVRHAAPPDRDAARRAREAAGSVPGGARASGVGGVRRGRPADPGCPGLRARPGDRRRGRSSSSTRRAVRRRRAAHGSRPAGVGGARGGRAEGSRRAVLSEDHALGRRRAHVRAAGAGRRRPLRAARWCRSSSSASRRARGRSAIRVLSELPIRVSGADDYLQRLRAARVEPDGETRRQRILEGARALASEVGGSDRLGARPRRRRWRTSSNGPASCAARSRRSFWSCRRRSRRRRCGRIRSTCRCADRAA